MITIEVKVGGRVVASAELVDEAEGIDATDYALKWDERDSEDGRPEWDGDHARIEGHNPGWSVWTLVAKAAAAILGQKADAMERKG